jgi:hypothetical protein
VTSPTISDLCHPALVSCDTISSERIAPPLAPDRCCAARVSDALYGNSAGAKTAFGSAPQAGEDIVGQITKSKNDRHRYGMDY